MTDLIKHYRQLIGIAHTWAAKHLPGWSDDSHRDLLARHGAERVNGRVSASTMNLAQLGAALEDYEKRGWQRRPFFADRAAGAGRSPRQVPPQIGHLFRLWGKLAQAGKVSDGGRPALITWCSRQVSRQVTRLDDLSPDELSRQIEALKSWLAR